MSVIALVLVTVIGSWYAASWLRNGWWLWLVVPALPLLATVAMLSIGVARNPEAEIGLMLAADSVGILIGVPIALIGGAVAASLRRRHKFH